MSSKHTIQVGGQTLWPHSAMQANMRADGEPKGGHDLTKPQPKRVQSNPRVGSIREQTMSPEAELKIEGVAHMGSIKEKTTNTQGSCVIK